MIDYTLPLDQLPDPLPIEPLRRPFDVTITPPGSKSITCRAYVLAALAEGESKIIRPLRADDTDYLLKALCTLGAEARWDGEDVHIKGVAGRFPRGGNLYMGDGGTPTRFMIACACLAKEPVVIDASPRMRERPIAEGVDMLRQLGARIEYVEEEGRLPVRVVPNKGVVGGPLTLQVTESSQFISGTLLIGTCLSDGVQCKFRNTPTSFSYLGLTRDVLQEWQVEISQRLSLQEMEIDGEIIVDPGTIQPRSYYVQPDASSALYWFLAAAIYSGCTTTISGFSSRAKQPDEMPIHYLGLIGAIADESVENEQTRIRLTGTDQLIGKWMSCNDCPDGAVGLAAALSLAQGASRIDGLRTLRVKETDRIAALANELRKVGCVVETGEDWIAITPNPGTPVLRTGSAFQTQDTNKTPGSENRGTNPVIIETYDDHRMAMAFAVLGLARPGISIRNPACVAKSYPGFWKDFSKLYQ